MSKKIGHLEFENFILRGENAFLAYEKIELINKIIQKSQIESSVGSGNLAKLTKSITDKETRKKIQESAKLLEEVSIKLKNNLASAEEKAKLETTANNLKEKMTGVIYANLFTSPEFLSDLIKLDPEQIEVDSRVSAIINKEKIEAIKYILESLGYEPSNLKQLTIKNINELFYEVMNEPENTFTDIQSFLEITRQYLKIM